MVKWRIIIGISVGMVCVLSLCAWLRWESKDRDTKILAKSIVNQLEIAELKNRLAACEASFGLWNDLASSLRRPTGAELQAGEMVATGTVERDELRAERIAKISDGRMNCKISSRERICADVEAANEIERRHPEISEWGLERAIGLTSGLSLTLEEREKIVLTEVYHGGIGDVGCCDSRLLQSSLRNCVGRILRVVGEHILDHVGMVDTLVQTFPDVDRPSLFRVVGLTSGLGLSPEEVRDFAIIEGHLGGLEVEGFRRHPCQPAPWRESFLEDVLRKKSRKLRAYKEREGWEPGQ